MNITLKKDSWHFKIYSKVYTNNTPKSLCPYFWKWVAILLISPILILVGVMRFLSNLFEFKSKPKKLIVDMTTEEIISETERLEKRLRRSEIGANIALGVGGVFMIGLLILTMYFGIKKEGWIEFFSRVFSLIGFIVTTYWVIVLISKTSKRIGNSNIVKVPLSMINAIYTRTCPIINWK